MESALVWCDLMSMIPSLANNKIGLSMQSLVRFASKVKVDRGSGCLLWTGYRCKGYGNVQIRSIKKGPTLSHHVAYMLANGGPIPKGMHVHHKCENPACVNPDHLELVTPAEHQERTPSSIVHSERARTHCPHGHEYTPENTIRYNGKRGCLACRREYDRRRHRVQQERRKAVSLPKTACKNGHPLTEENAYYYVGKDGKRERRCRVCSYDSSKRFRKGNKAYVSRTKARERVRIKIKHGVFHFTELEQKHAQDLISSFAAA